LAPMKILFGVIFLIIIQVQDLLQSLGLALNDLIQKL
jgi:hypothetical protein